MTDREPSYHNFHWCWFWRTAENAGPDTLPEPVMLALRQLYPEVHYSVTGKIFQFDSQEKAMDALAMAVLIFGEN